MKTWEGLTTKSVAKKIFELLELEYDEENEDGSCLRGPVRRIGQLRIGVTPNQIGIESRTPHTGISLGGVLLNSPFKLVYSEESFKTGRVTRIKKHITLVSNGGEATITDCGFRYWFGVTCTIH